MRESNGWRSVAICRGASALGGEHFIRNHTFNFTAALWLSALLAAGAAGLGPRTANTSLQFPISADTSRYTTEYAFGDVSFTHPVAVASPPGDPRVFVVEQGGAIVVVNPERPARQVFLNISERVAWARPEDEGGLLGLAFHPDYAANGYFYVYYLCNTTTADGSGRHNRLSRFTRSRNDPNRADPGSEVILFSQYDEKFNHNGGALQFGPDGYLYLSLGDEGHPDDMFDNAQRIDKDLFSAVIRIDVDKRPGNLPPNPHPALGGKTNYWIPADNPYVGATTFNGLPVNPAHVRTEFYAVGLRSPWRMHWDFATETLYLSDVGENEGEEFNIIVKGGNYGWPYRLANAPGPKVSEEPPGFSSIPPMLTYPRGDSGTTVGRAAIGGVVYRGTRFPELTGAYICGDFFSGNIWAVRHSGNTMTDWQHLMTMPQGRLVSFGIDPGNGDILICDIAEAHGRGLGAVKRLVPNTRAVTLPPTLAETGAFTDLGTLSPHAGIVPYDINVPFWSDGAVKKRWFSIPDVNARIRGGPGGVWNFPEGSIFIKHFELETTKGDPASRRRIETRFLVRNAEGMYGVTYKWDDSQANATLVGEDGDFATYSVNDGGTIREQTWRFPSRSECLSCHNSAAGHVLGLNSSQMNRTFNYGGFTANQIQALARAGYFAGAPPGGKKLVAADSKASLEQRARSYLAVNCAQCHRPGGLARSSWDARFTTPTARAGIVNGSLNENYGNPHNRVASPKSPENSMILHRMLSLDGNRMPPVGSRVVDEEGVALITQWIHSMPKRTRPLRVRLMGPAGARSRTEVVSLRGTATGDGLQRVVYSVNGGEDQEVSGVTEWTSDVRLDPGVNRITIQAEDMHGNRSRPVQRLIRYVAP